MYYWERDFNNTNNLTKTDYGYEYVVGTAGLDEVEITNEGNKFRIVGENTINDKHYRYEDTFYLHNDIYNNLEAIEHYTECGITFIKFIVNKKNNNFEIRHVKERTV